MERRLKHPAVVAICETARRELFGGHRRALRYVGHLESSTLAQIAEDCAQEASTSIVQRLHDFRGESKFTTWAYAFAVNTALTAARRERWSGVDLDRMPEGGASLSSPAGNEASSPDPERRALQRR